MPLTKVAAKIKDRKTGKAELQHRHFSTIATILRNIKAGRNICENFANELQDTNPRFDRERFMAACGYENGRRA